MEETSMRAFHFHRVLQLASVAMLISVAACSSSSDPTTGADGGVKLGDAGAGLTTGCEGLQKQCDSCADLTLKQACITSVVTFKPGGDAGQSGCQAVLDQGTYDSSIQGESRGPCAKPLTSCEVLSKSCGFCEETVAKANCSKLVQKADLDACRSATLNETFKSDGACCKVKVEGTPPNSEGSCQ
jgi:hypothetical protein